MTAMCNGKVSHTHRVGIVDDDDDVRDAIRTVLEVNGFLVSEYGSAQNYLASSRDDCALLVDLSMLGFSGLDLVELLRNGGIQIPVILMVDVTRPWQAQRIAAIQKCKVLHKPLNPHPLLTALGSSMSHAACSRLN